MSSLQKFLLIALAAVTVSGSPVQNKGSDISKRSDFSWRFYTGYICDHNLQEYSYSGYGNIGDCISAPVDQIDYRALEIDHTFGDGVAVVTYCDVGCDGGYSGTQSGTYCYLPPPNCATGSFRVSPI